MKWLRKNIEMDCSQNDEEKERRTIQNDGGNSPEVLNTEEWSRLRDEELFQGDSGRNLGCLNLLGRKRQIVKFCPKYPNCLVGPRWRYSLGWSQGKKMCSGRKQRKKKILLS